MILGMDVLLRLGVRIDTKTGTAQPTMLVTKIKPEESWKVPILTSVVFLMKNPYVEQEKKPIEKLPQMLRGTTSLGQGQRLYVRLQNRGEEDQVLDPNWEIGTVEVVEEEPDFPAGGRRRRRTPRNSGVVKWDSRTGVTGTFKGI